MDFGAPIQRPHLLDRAARLKCRAMALSRDAVMNGFARLSKVGLDAPAARMARRLIGAHLYAVKLEVNTACSLRCKMCYVDRTGQELPADTIDRLFRQLRGQGVRIEILGGEPLLRADLPTLVAAAKHRARSPYVSLYTNGVHATAQLARELAQAGLDAALVTLVSPDEAVHDAFVGSPGAFRRTCGGIQHLRAAGVDVFSLTSVHRENIQDVPAIHHYAQHELGVHPTFYQYVPRSPTDPLMPDPREWDAAKRWIVTETGASHMEFVRCFFRLTGCACSGGNFVLTVKADGSVQPCPFLDDLPLGNVHETDLFTIWRRRYEKPELLEFKSTPEECQDCTYRSVCGGGCRASSRLLHGTWRHRDQRCLGPFSEPLDRERMLEYLPSFF